MAISFLSADAPVEFLATGGWRTIIEDGGTYYGVHTFLTSGSFVPAEAMDVEYIVIAGGGGGGTPGGGGADGTAGGTSGMANTGGGGGGAFGTNTPGSGGSGIVIIRYAV